MPAVKPGPKRGGKAKLYYSTSYGTPTRVLIAEAIDVTVTSNKGKIDVMSRASDWKAKLAGLKELSLTFGYLYKSGTDAVFAALRAAYLADTDLVFWVMDDDIVNEGAQGFAFPAQIFDFPINQELESGINVEIGVELTRLIESAALVEPTWLTVSA
jgi:predicted secreted protein